MRHGNAFPLRSREGRYACLLKEAERSALDALAAIVSKIDVIFKN